MKPIHFRGNNYDPIQLGKMSGQGHKVLADTKDIITIAAAASIEARIAVQIDNKFHLLTGSIDTTKPMENIVVISKIVLKKAILQETTFTERSQMQREMVDQRRSQGINSYRY